MDFYKKKYTGLLKHVGMWY